LGPRALAIATSRKSPFPGGGDLPKQYYDAMDPFVSLTAAAVATTKLKVGTGVCLVQQRDPIQTAKGLAGGTFLTFKDAVRFALFETGGDSAHVHTHPEPEGARIDAPGPTVGLGCYRERLVPEGSVSSRRGHPPLFAEARPHRHVEIGRRCLRLQLP
jgi:hypothetical protein